MRQGATEKLDDVGYWDIGFRRNAEEADVWRPEPGRVLICRDDVRNTIKCGHSPIDAKGHWPSDSSGGAEKR